MRQATSCRLTPIIRTAPRKASPVSIRRRYEVCWTTFSHATSFTAGHHQRVSVSVVACPRNHFRYNSLSVPVKPPGRLSWSRLSEHHSLEGQNRNEVWLKCAFIAQRTNYKPR